MQAFSIIGCGRVGTSLAVFLSRAGYTVNGFFSRSAGSAEQARDAAGSGRVFKSPEEAASAGGIIFITTPDSSIESVCSRIAGNSGFRKGMLVMHCSGALSSEILASAAASGASTGSLHPLQSFAAYAHGQPSPFKGINISVEGDAVAVAAGTQMIRDLKAECVTIPTHAKTLYHASAVVASNYLVTVENFALQLLMEAGISETRAFEILEPLIRGTLANIKQQGIVSSLTGPIARGDAEIVANHMEALDKVRPEFSSLYRLLGRHTLEIAAARDDLAPESVLALKRLLD